MVVYDPAAGFVTGGGWFISQPGAYLPDSSKIGKAHFGFVSKYQKGKTIPAGHSEFQFQAADLNFSSNSYEWLVVSGKSRAQFKGTGTINGEGEYGFLVSVIDESNNYIDKFRIKIWDKNNDDENVYDNKEEMEIEEGSIVINTTNSKSKELVVESNFFPHSKQFKFAIYPNPFSKTLKLEFIPVESAFVRIDIFDMNGKLVRTIFEQTVEGGVIYNAEFKPQNLIGATYIYRITVGKNIYDGTVIYKKE